MKNEPAMTKYRMDAGEAEEVRHTAFELRMLAAALDAAASGESVIYTHEGMRLHCECVLFADGGHLKRTLGILEKSEEVADDGNTAA